MMEARRIIVIDDHPLLAVALCQQLERSGLEVIQLDPIAGAEQVLATVSNEAPDCVVVDLGMPIPGGGLSLIQPMVERGHRVAVLTGETGVQLLAEASGAGAEAVISKSEPMADIVETIVQVAGGQSVRTSQRTELAVERQRFLAERHEREAAFAELSPREEQVLAGLIEGRAPAVLAEENYVSVATVRSQIKSLLSKLGVTSQLQAVAMANRSQWSARNPKK